MARENHEKLINRLTSDILENEYFIELKEKANSIYTANVFSINAKEILSEKELTHLLKFADILSSSESETNRNESFKIVSNLFDSYSSSERFSAYAYAIIEKLGVFPASDLLQRKTKFSTELPFDRRVESLAKRELQRIPGTELILTDKQFDLYSKLEKKKSLSFAGPTSMGKSFVILNHIRRVIKNISPEDIVILVPTKALISQMVSDIKKDLMTELNQYGYRTITNSYAVGAYDVENDSKYIFILTPERLISLLNNNIHFSVGYLFVDEAQKLGTKKDERSITTYQAIEQAIERNKGVRLYFSSPNVSNPEVLLKLFGRSEKNIYRTSEGATSQSLYYIDFIDKVQVQILDGKKISIDDSIFETYEDSNTLIRDSSKGSNKIIYCSSVEKTLNRSRELLNIFKLTKKQQPDSDLKEAASQIREFIHEKYELADLVEHGIAFHFGKLPQAVRELIEKLFREEKIKYLFCTSTLLEGVNLPAKTVYILSNKKGNPSLDAIDFWNLSGRAGRLAKEFSGNIICIRDDEKQWNNTSILESKKEEIIIEPTVLPESQKKVDNMVRVLSGEQPNDKTQTLRNISKKVADLLMIDQLRHNTGYTSPLYEKYLEVTDREVEEIARNATDSIQIPLRIAKGNQYISFHTQDNVFSEIKSNNDLSRYKLSFMPTWDEVVKKMELIYDLYEFNENEKKISIKSLRYYGQLLNKWISGYSLKQIISESIDYNITHHGKVRINNEMFAFDKTLPSHISAIIYSVINDIEHTLKYVFENYFGHYYQCLQEIFGDECGANWAQFIEFGSNNNIVCGLQVVGVSRHTALYLNNLYGKRIKIDNGKVIGLNFSRIAEKVGKNSIYYDDIFNLSK